MRMGTALAVLLLAAAPAAAQAPAYMIEVRPSKRVEAVLTLEVNAPRIKAKEWVLYVPRLPELPGQAKVSSQLNFPSENVTELSAQKRPLLRARVKVKGVDQETKISLRATYEAELFSRKLVPLPEGAERPKVEPLSAAERKHFLEATALISFKAEAFKTWLKDNDLVRNKEESDLEYGKRLFQHLSGKFAYQYTQKMDRTAAAVCQAGRSDCGGLSVLFVAAMRSQGIPARIRAGRWAESAKQGQKLGEEVFLQQHAWPEFFCDGIGWVPTDPASAIYNKLGLACFGHDTGNFVTMHVDPELVLDTLVIGNKTEPFMQAAAYWVSAMGPFENVTVVHDWQVRELK